MLMGRGVSSQRLARSHAEKRRAVFSLRGDFLRVFLHVDQSAWRSTLVNSLLRVYGLLHRQWSKRVKRKTAQVASLHLETLRWILDLCNHLESCTFSNWAVQNRIVADPSAALDWKL